MPIASESSVLILVSIVFHTTEHCFRIIMDIKVIGKYASNITVTSYERHDVSIHQQLFVEQIAWTRNKDSIIQGITNPLWGDSEQSYIHFLFLLQHLQWMKQQTNTVNTIMTDTIPTAIHQWSTLLKEIMQWYILLVQFTKQYSVRPTRL